MSVKLNFKYFIRRPFMVRAVKVTAENIDEVAEWCDGAIVDDAEEERLFIRVPVEGARSVMQTEAHLGYWVVRSKNRGKYTFKVYRQVSLNREFVEIDDFGGEDDDTMEMRTTETDNDPIVRETLLAENVRKLAGKMIPSPTKEVPSPSNMAAFQRRTV